MSEPRIGRVRPGAEANARGEWLSDLTWPQAKARIDGGAVVLVPVGAAAKAHGHHLPLDTDRVLAIALAEAVARALPVLIAPVVDFGWYPAFRTYQGSQSIGAGTFTALMDEVLGKLIEDGARRVAVLNTGVSTEAPLAVAVRNVLERTGIKVAVADIRRLGRSSDRLLEQRCEGGHADERETSLMLCIDPGRVRMEAAVSECGAESTANVFHQPVTLSDQGTGADFSRTGATGDPTLATAGKGAAILQAMVADLESGLRTIFPDADGRR